jgi:DnaJ-class molecular chaperone
MTQPAIPAPAAPAAPEPQSGENTCRMCAGRGVLDGGVPCPSCGGSGKTVEPVGDA